MDHAFKNIAKTVKYVRVERNVNQSLAAEESGISLRTLQNIEAGKPVKSESLLKYLDYLDLLQPMLATLPDPDQLTPMELLKAAPKRRERARMKKPAYAVKSSPSKTKTVKEEFAWGDSK